MAAVLMSLTATLALCYVAWGFFHGYLHNRDIDFEEQYLSASFYFLGVAGVLTAIFWEYLHRVLSNYATTPLLVLMAVLSVVLAIHLLLPKYWREPEEYFRRHLHRSYLKFSWRRFISKSAEIVAQQVFIVVLVVLLNKLSLTLPQLIAVFCALFAFLHIPLLWLERGHWPMWAFLAAVIGFSIMFPYLILFVPYGFAYNIAIHWLFYTAMAVTFWVLYTKQKNI
jgi:hypothetical protein